MSDSIRRCTRACHVFSNPAETTLGAQDIVRRGDIVIVLENETRYTSFTERGKPLSERYDRTIIPVLTKRGLQYIVMGWTIYGRIHSDSGIGFYLENFDA